jgi:lipooligosaccharide transport system permease protein
VIDVRRVIAVYRRNLLVWRKLAPASLVGNIAEPLITLLAFGYGLGSLLREVEGVPYVVYLAAGAICMSTTMAASFESLYSAFARMQVQRTWDSILNAPVSLDEVLVAEWLWAASKGALSGVAIVVVAFALDISRTAQLIWVFPLIVLTGLCFAAIGLVFTAMARGYDFFTFYFTLGLTPMIFVSGVYYPVEALPTWLAALSSCFPLSAAVSMVRPFVLGGSPDELVRPLLLLAAWTGGALFLARTLTVRRFSR